MDYLKVSCNAIIAFCTSFLAAGLTTPGVDISSIAIMTAVITAILSAAIEVKQEISPPQGLAAQALNRVLVL